MVIMGLDYGERRIGVAVCDRLEVAAHSLPTVQRDGAEMETLAAMIEQRGVEQVVVGLPLRTNGSHGPEAHRVRGFMKRLRAVVPDVEVVGMDERFTTAQAQRALSQMGATLRERRRHVDAIAAQIILQSYLERRRREDRDED